MHIHAIEPTRSRGQRRVDGVGRLEFHFHSVNDEAGHRDAAVLDLGVAEEADRRRIRLIPDCGGGGAASRQWRGRWRGGAAERPARRTVRAGELQWVPVAQNRILLRRERFEVVKLKGGRRSGRTRPRRHDARCAGVRGQ